MHIRLKNEDFKALGETILKPLSLKETKSQVYLTINPVSKKLGLMCRTQTTLFRGEIDIQDLEDIEDIECFSVEGNQLKAIVSVLGKESGDLVIKTLVSGRTFVIEYKESSFKLPVFDTTEMAQNEEVVEVGTVSGAMFMNSISSLSKVCATDLRYSEHGISCIGINVTRDNITFVASNSICIIEVIEDVEDIRETYNVLVKPAQASLLCNTDYAKVDDVLELIKTDTMIGIKDKRGNVCLVATADIEALRYEAHKERAAEDNNIVVNHKDLTEALNVLGKLCSSDRLTFQITKDSLVIVNENQDKITLPALSSTAEDVIVLSKSSVCLLLDVVRTKNIRFTYPNERTKRICKIKGIAGDNTQDIETVFAGILSYEE